MKHFITHTRKSTALFVFGSNYSQTFMDLSDVSPTAFAMNHGGLNVEKGDAKSHTLKCHSEF